MRSDDSNRDALKVIALFAYPAGATAEYSQAGMPAELTPPLAIPDLLQ
jgi:hypothetical protein